MTASRPCEDARDSRERKTVGVDPQIDPLNTTWGGKRRADEGIGPCGVYFMGLISSWDKLFFKIKY